MPAACGSPTQPENLNKSDEESTWPRRIPAVMGDDEMLSRTATNPDLVRRWTLDLKRRNRRPRTILTYSQRVNSLSSWLGAQSLLEATTTTLEDWLDSHHVQPNTRAAYIAGAASFYRWALGNDLVDVDPAVKVARPQLQPGRPRPIADDALALALAEAPQSTRCMILLGALAGLRVSEIAGLRVEDLDLTKGLLEVVEGAKGGRTRFVPVHPVLAEGLRLLPLPRSGYVFRRADGVLPLNGHIVGDRIRAVLRRYAGGGTAHDLRHWSGTAWYAIAHDIRAVAELLGHANVNTSRVYARFDLAQGTAIVNAVKVPGAAFN